MSEQRPRWRLTRRGFLIGTGAAGGLLALGVTLGLPEARLRIAGGLEGAVAPGSLPDDPAIWFEAAEGGRLRLFLPKVELGQGIHTALAQIAADELELPLERLEVRQASSRVGPADESGTQGSSSVTTVYAPLREAAATLREMLRARAAEHLGVTGEAPIARDGAFEAEGRRVEYEALLAEGGEWEVPDGAPPLKRADAFRLIGQPVPRLDVPAKVTGRAVYGYDARTPGMRYGAVLHPPTIGATLRRVRNADEVRQRPGVVAVVVEAGFAGVVAESRQAAWEARDALQAEWDEGRRWQQAELEELVSVGGRGGVTIQRVGDAPAALARGTPIEAEYRTPFAVHAPMEPQAALAQVSPESVRVWVSTQMQARTAALVARTLGRPEAQVEVIPTLVGGGFGRKGISEVAVEAVRLSAAAGVPVHVGWTRVEEMRHGYFRPPTHHRLRGTVADGRIAAIEHQQASGDVLFGYFPAPIAAVLGVDFGAYRGARFPYAIPHRRVVAWRRTLPVKTGPWRGLGLLANVFATESFVDELAHVANADPLAFRLAQLPDDPTGQRLRAVLEAAAGRAGWTEPPAEGRARGIACCLDAGTAIAEVAEVALRDDGTPRVHRVVAAMDCGLVINPDGAAAQVEGNVMWGVGSALHEQVTIRDGQVQLGNFDTYPLLTMDEAPQVEVVLVPSPLDVPRGVGEPAIGPVAAAIANALFALTGQRVRQLPLRL